MKYFKLLIVLLIITSLAACAAVKPAIEPQTPGKPAAADR